MRKAFVLLVVGMTLALVLGLPAFRPASVQAQGPPPKLSLTIYAGQGSDLVFDPDTIPIAQFPIVLNITVRNNGTAAIGRHTFTINDNQGVVRINVDLTTVGDSGSVEFQANSTREIFYSGTTFVPEGGTAGILFYCIPHRQPPLNMVGQITQAGGGTPSEERGLFLRAYWIGVIALAAMLLWTVITYFVIKTSSRHSTDHREHIRRGLP